MVWTDGQGMPKILPKRNRSKLKWDAQYPHPSMFCIAHNLNTLSSRIIMIGKRLTCSLISLKLHFTLLASSVPDRTRNRANQVSRRANRYEILSENTMKEGESNDSSTIGSVR